MPAAMSDATGGSAAMGDGRRAAQRIGRVGAWSFAMQAHRAQEERRAVDRLEELGYGTVWVPESIGSKDAMAHAAILLSGGERIVVATGIASIWARDAMAAKAGALALAEASDGRFVLGLGVSHRPAVELRGGRYRGPAGAMRSYLDQMEEAAYVGPPPSEPVPRVLAALGPKMLGLAAERADGAHSYFVPVDHTSFARDRLGPEPVLAVEMTAVLQADRGKALDIARGFAGRYLQLENYANNLRRLGWAEEDLAEGGSERLIDAVVVSGGVDTVAARVREHHDAGADHVCVQFLGPDRSDLCLPHYEELSSALALRR
jgi:probable F420-dependent oxidoreductase